MGLELGLQLVALFGKAVKPLRGGLFLDKSMLQGQGALRFYSSAPLPSLSLSTLGLLMQCVGADPVLPHCDGLCPSGTVSQRGPSPVSCLCQSVLSQQQEQE